MGESTNYPADDGGINFLDYLPVLWRYRLLIGVLFLISLLYGLISGLFSPRIYEATATVIRLNGGGEINLLSMLVQQVGLSRGGGVPGGRGDSLLSVLRSRLMAEELAKSPGLQKYYSSSPLQDAASLIRGATKIVPSKEGTIEIKVADKDPQKAADIANSYGVEVNRIMTRLGAGMASQQRRFVVERLRETEGELRKAEEALKGFQEKNRLPVIPSQTGEAIGVAASLRGQLMAAEIQLQQIRSFATESNPEVVRLKRTIAELKRQMGQVQYGTAIDLPPSSQNPRHLQKDMYLPAAKVPETLLEFTRLTRDVRVQEAVYTLLTQQLEQAKITEAQDAPVVHLLDPALVPEQPLPKKIGQKMVIHGLLGILAGIIIVLAFDYTLCNWAVIKSRALGISNQ